MSFFNELKRRNVIRVAAGYVVLAWLVVQVVETIFPAFGFGDEAVRFVVIGFAVGFIPVVVLAWVFEWTPQGIRVDDGDAPSGPASLAMAKRWDRVVMVILAIAVVFFIVENLLDEDPIDVQPAIAVLPFEGTNLPSETAHLPNTLAEGMYTSLARIPQLTVSAWPTVNRLANEGLDNDQIVEALGAANSLRGLITVNGDQVEITARLVATDLNSTIWEESFDGSAADIFDFHYEIVAAVAEKLQLGATGILYKARPSDPDAQRLTLQAWSTLTRVNLPNNGSIASELLRQALEIDPDYVRALNLLSMATFTRWMDGDIPADEADDIYKETQERVAAIDHEDGLQNAYNAWGLFWDDNEPAHANQHLQIALRTGLNEGEALRAMAGFARRTGNAEAALWFGERAVAIDPTCENCIWQTTENLFYAGRFEEAIAAKKRFQAFGGGGYPNHAYMLLRLGRPQAALDLIDSIEGRDPDQFLGLQAMAYYTLGNTESYEANVARLRQLEKWSDLAEIHAFNGDVDRAFEALDRAWKKGERLVSHVFLPQWDNLRDDPRWAEFREQIGLPEKKTEVLDFAPVLKYTQ